MSNWTILVRTTTIDPWIKDGVAACGKTQHARPTPTLKGVITDMACSSAHIFRIPGDVIMTGRDGTTPRGGNVVIRSPGVNYPVLIGGVTTTYPTRMGRQEIVSPKGPTGSVEVRNSQIFNTSINGNLAENGDPTPIFSKVIG